MKVPETGEVMAVMQTAMLAGLPSTRLRDAVLAHPTFAEGHGRCSRKYRPAQRSRPRPAYFRVIARLDRAIQ